VFAQFTSWCAFAGGRNSYTFIFVEDQSLRKNKTMSVKQLNINGTTFLCVVTPNESNRLAKGQKVNIPADRRVKYRLGIPRAIQLHNAGIIAPPVVF
jgi:hypothetical protein